MLAATEIRIPRSTMTYRSLPAVLAVLLLASCATEKPNQNPGFDKQSVNFHLQDLVYDSSVFGSAISCIRDGRIDAAVNRLELAPDTTILRIDELISYADSKTQRQAIRELHAIKAARKLHPRRDYVGSGRTYDADISNIVYRAESILNLVE